MIVVHAKPNTHPGGIQGGSASYWYQSEPGRSPIKKEPSPSAEKLTNKKMMILIDIPTDI